MHLVPIGIVSVLTLEMGGAAIWIIFVAEHQSDDKTWAYGTLGMLLGYWLKWKPIGEIL